MEWLPLILCWIAIFSPYAQASSIADVEKKLDMNNRAYYMTIVMQRWLAIRLDFFGNVLVLGIALFGAAASKTVNPAKTSVALTYTLGSERLIHSNVHLTYFDYSNPNIW